MVLWLGQGSSIRPLAEPGNSIHYRTHRLAGCAFGVLKGGKFGLEYLGSGGCETNGTSY